MVAILIIAAVLVVFIIGTYNTLQRLKTQIKASIQEIGNQLKRQASLIPNLEASVKGQMKHEKAVYKMLADARKSVTKADQSGNIEDINTAIENIQSLIPKIQVVVESNPELKSNETVTKFMDELTDTADKLTYARRSVIDLTQSFNEKLVVFPTNLIAMIFGFKEERGISTPMTGDHVEVSSSETKSPKVEL